MGRSLGVASGGAGPGVGGGAGVVGGSARLDRWAVRDGPGRQGEGRLDQRRARLTGIAPGLSVAAAIGLAVLPLGGLVLHLRRGESSQAVPNIVISALAAITAWLAAATL
jgi:hypothetical protein